MVWKKNDLYISSDRKRFSPSVAADSFDTRTRIITIIIVLVGKINRTSKARDRHNNNNKKHTIYCKRFLVFSLLGKLSKKLHSTLSTSSIAMSDEEVKSVSRFGQQPFVFGCNVLVRSTGDGDTRSGVSKKTRKHVIGYT